MVRLAEPAVATGCYLVVQPVAQATGHDFADQCQTPPSTQDGGQSKIAVRFGIGMTAIDEQVGGVHLQPEPAVKRLAKWRLRRREVDTACATMPHQECCSARAEQDRKRQTQ